MLKKISLSLVLLYSSNTMPMQHGMLGSDFNSHVGNIIVSHVNALHAKLSTTDNEAKELRKEIEETKKLLQESQSHGQVQNSVIRLQEITQSLLNDSFKNQSALQTQAAEIGQLQKKLEFFCQQAVEVHKLHQRDSQTLSQLQESRTRIKSMLAVLSSSKSSDWETAFIEMLKEELK